MPKILIADDEPDVLSVLAKKVSAAGYEVITAMDGQEAWDKIVSREPDAVLLDLSLPGLHGFEVLEKLRSNPPFKKWCPVIIISGHDELENIKKGIALEAEHYLTKPCAIDEVLKAITLALHLKNQRKQEE